MKTALSRVAQQELADAFRYYEHEQLGLGNRFLDEVEHARQLIAQLPHAWHATRCVATALCIAPLSIRPDLSPSQRPHRDHSGSTSSPPTRILAGSHSLAWYAGARLRRDGRAIRSNHAEGGATQNL